jgi:hypothetical protein
MTPFCNHESMECAGGHTDRPNRPFPRLFVGYSDNEYRSIGFSDNEYRSVGCSNNEYGSVDCSDNEYR